MRAVPLDAESLARFVESNAAPVWAFSPEKFRGWLLQRVREQEHNAVFQQKRRIQAILRTHRDTLRPLEKEAETARAAYEQSPHFELIERLLQQIHRLQRGVDGLRVAVDEGRARPEKLAAHQNALQQREAELALAVSRCRERDAWERAAEELSQRRAVLGVTSEESELARLQRHRGRRSGAVGERFEQIAETALCESLNSFWPEASPRSVVLRGVTLGAAQTELDFVIGQIVPGRPEIDVLAIVEAKRNINDVVTGFLQRQRNIGWLTRDETSYDPAVFRTQSFPTGHFDRPATHRQGRDEYVLTSDSFRRFHRDRGTGWFLDRLYFVTRLRPLLGVTTLELARIMNRVATRPEFDENDPQHVARLLEWSRTFVSRSQTCDVLRMYGASQLAHQILIVNRDEESVVAGFAPTE